MRQYVSHLIAVVTIEYIKVLNPNVVFALLTAYHKQLKAGFTQFLGLGSIQA